MGENRSGKKAMLWHTACQCLALFVAVMTKAQSSGTHLQPACAHRGLNSQQLENLLMYLNTSMQVHSNNKQDKSMLCNCYCSLQQRYGAVMATLVKQHNCNISHVYLFAAITSTGILSIYFLRINSNVIQYLTMITPVTLNKI